MHANSQPAAEIHPVVVIKHSNSVTAAAINPVVVIKILTQSNRSEINPVVVKRHAWNLRTVLVMYLLNAA